MINKLEKRQVRLALTQQALAQNIPVRRIPALVEPLVAYICDGTYIKNAEKGSQN